GACGTPGVPEPLHVLGAEDHALGIVQRGHEGREREVESRVPLKSRRCAHCCASSYTWRRRFACCPETHAARSLPHFAHGIFDNAAPSPFCSAAIRAPKQPRPALSRGGSRIPCRNVPV